MKSCFKGKKNPQCIFINFNIARDRPEARLCLWPQEIWKWAPLVWSLVDLSLVYLPLQGVKKCSDNITMTLSSFVGFLCIDCYLLFVRHLWELLLIRDKENQKNVWNKLKIWYVNSSTNDYFHFSLSHVIFSRTKKKQINALFKKKKSLHSFFQIVCLK